MRSPEIIVKLIGNIEKLDLESARKTKIKCNNSILNKQGEINTAFEETDNNSNKLKLTNDKKSSTTNNELMINQVKNNEECLVIYL